MAQACAMPKLQTWNPGQPVRRLITDGRQNSFPMGHDYAPSQCEL
jgi:hypothetical protein